MAEPTTKRSGSRIGLAFKAFGRISSDAKFADQVYALMQGQAPQLPAEPAKPTPVIKQEPPKPALHPLQLLAILQREGRLVDFLMEDIQGISDVQVGAAVREVHQKCRKALQDHVPLEPVMAEAEESAATVQPGYDPSAVRVVGNLGANPPYSGTVRHRGWRAKDVRLQPLPAGQDPRVVAPAEVEVP
jgi:hypothetical protein